MKIGKVFTNLANKVKGNGLKSKKTIIAMVALTIGSAFALSSATFAWFYLSNNGGAQMATFSGDLGVTIEKVSAYKYIYPYHNNSTEFVDYDGVGQVKSYVVEDASVNTPSNLANTVTFTLGINGSAHSYTTTSSSNSATNIYYEDSQDFHYYLMGDSTFTGVSTNEWSTLTATAFARKDAPVVGEPVTVDNVVVSIGAEFILFNAGTISGPTCDYYTYNSPSTSPSGNARFTSEDGKSIKCLKAGIYTFQYRVDAGGTHYLDIILTSRNDNAIIGNNLIDPTKITIDYRGTAAATYESINDYLPYAIYEQNTQVVLDVELSYQNKNEVETGLKIIRNPDLTSVPYIYNYTGKYATTNAYTYRGYVDSSHRNPLNASDFYAFYTMFTAVPYATPTAAWDAFRAMPHPYQTDYEIVAGKNRIVDRADPYNKFQNDTELDTSVECDIHVKENTDSTLIPESNTPVTYHCYIAIDYDYEYMQFFTNQERVGKTYLLDRDFYFYFSAEEHIELAPAPSPLKEVRF